MKAVDPLKAKGYLTKAEKSLEMAKIARERGAYDNAVMSAIHSAINALDALTTSHLGKRSSGQHSEVLSLIKGIFPSLEYAELSKQFTSLLSLKNESEYQPNLLKDADAENSIKWAERILGKVQIKMKGKI
jgi:uncharacterized protein (UPF0332 family)